MVLNCYSVGDSQPYMLAVRLCGDFSASLHRHLSNMEVEEEEEQDPITKRFPPSSQSKTISFKGEALAILHKNSVGGVPQNIGRKVEKWQDYVIPKDYYIIVVKGWKRDR